MALFENYDRRIAKINGVLAEYGIGSVEDSREIFPPGHDELRGRGHPGLRRRDAGEAR